MSAQPTFTFKGRVYRVYSFPQRVRDGAYETTIRLEDTETGESVFLTEEMWQERKNEVADLNARCRDLHVRLGRLDKATRRRVMLASVGYVPAHFSALASGELARLDKAVLDAEKREYEPA